MEVGILGPAEVHRGEVPVDLGTRKQRAVVAALALSRGRAVSVDTIVDLLWGDEPPRGVSGTLQAYIAGLRKALEPDRAARAPASVLVTVPPGYALRLPDEAFDVVRFERVVAEVHQALEPISQVHPVAPMPREELTALARRLDGALALWRGQPFAELDDAPAAEAERVRLEELRLVAVEDRIITAVALGQHATAVPELESLTRLHPLRERLWALRAVALVRSGRQAEALEVLRDVRTVLDEELGIEPGQGLRDLQAAVLRQDPVLEWTAPRTGVASTATAGPAAEATAGVAAAGAARATVETVPAPTAVPAGPAARSTAPWPMVGRDAQLAALTDLLETSAEGRTSFAALVGEPGIGKTRLASELLGLARERGATVLTGRCSQDDGAPPLWPWASVLRDLGRDLPTDSSDDDEGGRFRTWESIVAAVVEASGQGPVVVALDDLHWADASSLRVLRLLGETVEAARLLVLVSWRAHPEPTGPLAEVAETLARRHALRLELEGLTSAEAAEVVETVAHARPSPEEASALRERTEGNPFFLVEFARLAADRGDLGQLLAEEHPPAAVHDVLVRRLERLPQSSVGVLRTAAVVGRQFDLPTLADSAGLPEDDVLDALEPAEQAGLVREDGIDRFVFAHALVRDTIYSGLSASRRARLHARVAEVLQRSPGRETERARHWLAAGPAHASRAWLAAVSAAVVTRRLHAHDQSAELLVAALDVMVDDPDATDRDRYDVLLQLVDAWRWLGRWNELVRTVEQAIDVAERIGDVELVSRAAISPTLGALWQSGGHGEVHEKVVAALRRCLDRLPAEDSALRCRTMLGLANELYYGATFEERRALVDEALAMARRIDDDALLLDACQIAFSALWSPRTTRERLGLVQEAIELARRLDHERALVVSLTLRAVVEGELGMVEQMWHSAAVARREVERLRLPYGLIVLDSLELPWLAMAGRFDECEERMERIVRLDQQMSLQQSADATAGALISLRLWQGRSAEVAPVLAMLDESPLPATSARLLFLLRGGMEAEARELLTTRRVELEHDDWFSMLNWCCAAEAALWLGDRDLAAAAYEKIAPYEGFTCSAGSGSTMGPADAYLAEAAAAVGERELAGRHADRALELMEAWEIPLAAQWMRDQRERFSF
ncbi:Transcriptional regulatory protein, C terminal [Pedococcus cremeus]|uniref:Transcriptional regulatory protein, C terminal n=1 Tax=Pedococcus cremeus TaxID=587636 RepID=A0A1H9XQ31_9MICO|nr:AfsR/SARP family transcriptional regulator [Pedococcus cremeus]SES48252.1 Transcriptional regulatory protein, C terminal [Pedococcus cremeus]